MTVPEPDPIGDDGVDALPHPPPMPAMVGYHTPGSEVVRSTSCVDGLGALGEWSTDTSWHRSKLCERLVLQVFDHLEVLSGACKHCTHNRRHGSTLCRLGIACAVPHPVVRALNLPYTAQTGLPEVLARGEYRGSCLRRITEFSEIPGKR